MISVTLVIPSHRRSTKPTLRTIARTVSVLQVAEGAALHADRDGCIIHKITSGIARRPCTAIIPRRLMRNPEWVHRHIEAPGVRIQARIEDRWRAS